MLSSEISTIANGSRGVNKEVSDVLHTCADEETLSKPGLEEFVFSGLVDVDLTVEDDLNVIWVGKEDDEV